MFILQYLKTLIRFCPWPPFHDVAVSSKSHCSEQGDERGDVDEGGELVKFLRLKSGDGHCDVFVQSSFPFDGIKEHGT